MSRRRWLRFLLWTAVLLTALYVWAVTTDAVPWLRGPRPWPPEWQWSYRPLGWERPGRIAVQLGLLIAYLGCVGWLMRTGARRRVRLTLSLAVTFFLVWQLAQTWVREADILDTLIFRTYAPSLNGFFIAPAQVTSVSETLRHYLAAMPHFFGDKPQTHPPGLFIFYALSNDFFAGLPRLSASFASIARTWAIPGRDWPQLADSLVVSAFATSCVQAIITALAPLSLYALLRQTAAIPNVTESGGTLSGVPAVFCRDVVEGRRSGHIQAESFDCAAKKPLLRSGCFGISGIPGQTGAQGWPGMPADLQTGREPVTDLALWAALALPLIAPFTLFFLQWDTVFPTLGFAAWYFAVRGQNRQWQSGSRGPSFASDWLLAGLLFSLMTWLSFGTVVFGVMIVLHVFWRAGARRMAQRCAGQGGLNGTSLWPTVTGIALMAVGWALPWVLVYFAWDMSFLGLARAGMGFHYALVTAQRSYRLWLWMNPVDLALWLGPAPLLLGVVGSLWLWRRAADAGRPGEFDDWVVDLAGMAGIFWLIMVYLNVSGATRGEVGRLWMFLMPFPVIFGFALPWRPRERLVILALLAAGSWVMGYAIAGIIA